MTGADLSGADLTDAILKRAVLDKAILSGAVVEGADLSGVDLPHDISRVRPSIYDHARVGLAERRQITWSHIRGADWENTFGEGTY